MTISRRMKIAALLAPLALAISACDSAGSEGEDAIAGEPVAAVPAPEGQEWAEVTTVTEQQGHQIGNPDAAIKLVEYASLTCPTCASFSQAGFETLRDEYVNSGRVSFELRPLVLNGYDLVLSRLARCSTDEAVVPLSEQVWTNFAEVMGNAQQNGAAMEQAMSLPEDQRFVGVAEATGLFEFFAARGLSRDQARSCLADVDSVKGLADRSSQQGEEFGVTGTPTFFVNGQKVEGVVNWEGVEPILQRAGAR
ncbi:thioredoxin domain-containing protein [Parerythrobacter jejuensis]|uniref:Thioredoxin domain-containing protein n=1 Tax=Parerythrobacter jejuensis TaxID=795812 RepID=A0A845AU39_9SPHN|nr:thioredoxin domain-containing protein [Parerythrobacter jejuensis]MXP32827.1 thioredoxin domain-containing protein [Parerythrobacter jejuensis]